MIFIMKKKTKLNLKYHQKRIHSCMAEGSGLRPALRNTRELLCPRYGCHLFL